MTRLPTNAFRLYTSETPAGHDLYPGKIGERVPRTQTGAWERRVVTGPVAADAETLISSWTQDDYSGGFGIKDGNESTDTSRIAFGVIDGRRPKSMCLPPLTEEVASPTWVETGSFYPLGDVGTQFYGAWANGIAGWNTATDAWHTTQNAWPASFAPVNHPVAFCGFLYVPGGAQGLLRLSELTAATGTLTVSAAMTGVKAVALGLHDDKLWAIDTSNHLWMLTALGAAAGGVTVGNWGGTNGAGTFTGTQVKDAFGNAIVLDTGASPTRLFSWFNSAQQEALWCVTRAKAAYVFNPDEGRWIKTRIKGDAHPDWGFSAEVFRDGEDLFISAGGLDVTRLTVANVEVPISGPSKDQGVPPEYQGNIVDLNSERSSLYALVQGGDSVAVGAPTNMWVVQQTVGTQGSGTSPVQFDTPNQVAINSSGHVYVADGTNFRVLKLSAAGAFLASIATGNRPWGVCLDSSDNLYAITADGGSGFAVIKKYNSAGTLLLTSATLSFAPRYATTDSTNLFITDVTNHRIQKLLCSTLATNGTIGTAGTGNGQFDDPFGITHDGTHLYVTDSGNSRVQKLLLSDGSYVAKWGSLGTADGSFTSPRGVAMDDSGDVWVCDFGNSRLQRFSNAGVYQTKIAQSSPKGIDVATGDVLWVSTSQHTLVQWDEETVTTEAVEGKAWLGAWTGTAWCALWEGDEDLTLTWMRLALKGDYALWWGDTDGRAYRQLLPPPFFNPAARVKLAVYPFAPTGWMETMRYDANMGGWDKIAAHFFAMMEYAAADVYVDIAYRTDADQFDTGLLDPPYRAWKRVDHIGRTLCRFDDTNIDPISGLPWREGEPFQWIQFRYDFARGSNTFLSPIWMWHSLHHLSVPQDSASFTLKIPLGQKPGKPFNRSPDEMAETLRALQTTRKMVHLQTRNPDPSHPEWQVFFRGRVTQVKSEFYLGADNNLDEVVVVSFVEIGESSNEHTTVAVDTP
jgi:sugar lactone lactonase YvrE